MSDESNMNAIALSPEQLASITTAVTASLTDTIDTRFQELENKTKTPADPPANPPANPPADPPAITPESVAQAVLGMVQKTQVDDANKVFGVLYKEKMQGFTDKLPGFEEFMDSEDDYGDKRGEKLNEIEDYEARLGKLEKMATNYGKALENNQGQSPQVSVKAQKQAEDNQSAFDKAKSEFHDGGSATDYEDAFFSALENEISSLMGS